MPKQFLGGTGKLVCQWSEAKSLCEFSTGKQVCPCHPTGQRTSEIVAHFSFGQQARKGAGFLIPTKTIIWINAIPKPPSFRPSAASGEISIHSTLVIPDPNRESSDQRPNGPQGFSRWLKPPEQKLTPTPFFWFNSNKVGGEDKALLCKPLKFNALSHWHHRVQYRHRHGG